MKGDRLHVRELAGWGFDASLYRPPCDDAVERAEGKLGLRAPFVAMDRVVAMEPEVGGMFAEQATRADLREEMDGLTWRLGVVDLRGLIAFQRRVVFDPRCARDVTFAADDWQALFGFAFGPAVPSVYRMIDGRVGEFLIETENPNLQLRSLPTGSNGPFVLHGGSPFFEVGEYRGRWFLRDGYHRAYALLRAGIVRVPAVIVHARTLRELGPVGDWFFAEEILLGERPPLVMDFLDDEMAIVYTRPRMLKTIRITVDESFAPATTEAASGGV